MSDYDFKNLTENQQWLLTYQGWHLHSTISGHNQPSKRTVKKLIDRGLLIEKPAEWAGMQFMEYEVPLPVHMAWCQWCAEQP